MGQMKEVPTAEAGLNERSVDDDFEMVVQAEEVEAVEIEDDEVIEVPETVQKHCGT